MKYKVLALLMAVVLVSAIFIGCSTQKEKEPNDSPDATTTASLVKDEEAFKKAISKEGTWIVCTLEDMEFDEELLMEGEFRDKGDPNGELYRKLALYAQDENRNVTARYKLTVPKLTIKSPNTRIQGGTVVGDIYVEANGFNLQDATVEGNVYFASQEYKDSYSEKDATVSGKTEVKE